MITPQTDVILLKVPLEINDNNQLTFENAEAQYNYFHGLPKIEFESNFTYQRKDGTIRVPALIDDIMNYNYVMYRNEAYNNKWFYAFIDNMEWLSDGVTAVKIRTDVWQTWQFDLNYKPVLVEREHTNDDTIGVNTQPEGLELGEFVTNGDVINFASAGGSDLSQFCAVVEVSMIQNEGNSTQTLRYSWGSGTHEERPTLNAIYRGTIPLVLGIDGSFVDNPSNVVDVYDYAGLGSAIVQVYMIPKSMVTDYNVITIESRSPTSSSWSHSVTCVIPNASTLPYDLGTTTFNRPLNINDYYPKNAKLLTYPFCFFNISNNAGTSMPYRYEDFDGFVRFKTEGTFGVSASIKTIPQNYKFITSEENALDYSISAPKYPVCSWESDSYTNWLTQNAVNMQTQWISAGVNGATQIVAGGISGGGLGAGSGAIQAVADLISVAREQYLAKTSANFVPDTVHGNGNAGEIVWSKYRSPFTYLPMAVKREYAERIDQFFSMFGYQTNLVKLPNITGRRNWNYVKTIGCYIEGDIPQRDLQEIKSMFNRGITFWHNPATFADYSQNNDII